MLLKVLLGSMLSFTINNVPKRNNFQLNLVVIKRYLIWFGDSLGDAQGLLLALCFCAQGSLLMVFEGPYATLGNEPRTMQGEHLTYSPSSMFSSSMVLF